MSIPSNFNPLGLKKEILPPGYKRVEYLESTGTQYIDTGVYGTEHHGVDIKYQYPELGASSARLFGGRTGAPGTNAYAYIGSYSGTTSTGGNNFFVACNQGGWRSVLPYMNDSKHVVIWNKDGSSLSFTFDSVAYNADEGIIKSTPFQHTFTTNIFRAYNGSSYATPATARVYYCKIFDNGHVIRNFVPALDPTGRPCMYDLAGTGTAEQNTYYNAATEGPDFLWRDPREELPAGYRRCTYLESDGTQYIDAILKPSEFDAFKIEYQVTKTTVNPGNYFGVDDSVYPNLISQAITAYQSSMTWFAYGNKETSFNFIIKSRTTYQIDSTTAYLTYDGTTKTCVKSGTVIDVPMYLFRANGAAAETEYKDTGLRIFYAEFAIGGRTLAHLVPCLSPDNTPCMVDTVTGTVYSNKGDGTFLWG